FMGRAASMLALVIAGLVAPMVHRYGGIFNYFQQSITYVTTPLIAVILVGIFWRRANAQGALAGHIAGLAVTAVLFVTIVAQIDLGLHWLYIGFFLELLVIAVVIAVSLMTPAPSPEQAEPFFWRPSMMSDHTEHEKERPWYAHATLW